MGELLKAAERLGVPEFPVADLITETGWGKSKTYEVMGRAEEFGCIAEGDRRGRYRLIRNHAEPPLALPAKVKLTAEDFRISTGNTPENFRISRPGRLATLLDGRMEKRKTVPPRWVGLDGKTENRSLRRVRPIPRGGGLRGNHEDKIIARIHEVCAPRVVSGQSRKLSPALRDR